MMKMSAPSIIFWLIFVVPLAGFLFWTMRQDKRKGKFGLFFVAALLVIAIVYMYVFTKGQ